MYCMYSCIEIMDFDFIYRNTVHPQAETLIHHVLFPC